MQIDYKKIVLTHIKKESGCEKLNISSNWRVVTFNNDFLILIGL